MSMNTIIFFLSIYSISLINGLYAGNDEELFLRGNKLYQEEKCMSAVELYSAIKNKGPAVWYNMGNCYYHMDNRLEALACWYRAKKGAPAWLYRQIDHTVVSVAHDQEKYQSNGIDLLFNNVELLIASTSLLLWQILLLLVVYVNWLLYRRRSLQRISWAKVVVLGVLLMVIGLGLKIKYTQQASRLALISQSSAQLYAGPNKEYYKIHTFNNNDVVYIQSVMGDWYKINYPKGSGWIYKDDIYDLEEVPLTSRDNQSRINN